MYEVAASGIFLNPGFKLVMKKNIFLLIVFHCVCFIFRRASTDPSGSSASLFQIIRFFCLSTVLEPCGSENGLRKMLRWDNILMPNLICYANSIDFFSFYRNVFYDVVADK